MKFLSFLLFFFLLPKILFSEVIYFPKEKEPKGLLGLKFGVFSFGSELETELLVPQGSELLSYSKGSQGIFHRNDKKVSFRVDQFVFSPQVEFKDLAKFYVDLEFRSNRSEVDTAFLRKAIFSLFLPSDLFVKIGIDNRFMDPTMGMHGVSNDKRFTEAFPINGIAFWKDEMLAVTLGGDHRLNDKTQFYWRSGISNGLPLGHEELTRNKIYPIIQDDRELRSINIDLTGGQKEIMWGLGLRQFFSQNSFMNTLLFLLHSDLSTADIEFLRAIFPRYQTRSQKHYRAGLSHELNLSHINIFTQFIQARDGRMIRDGFYIQPSILLFKRPNKEFLSGGIRFLYRFNFLNIDVKGIGSNISTSPLTWDRTTHTAAINVQVHPYVLWRNEYHFNWENTGNSNIKGVDNNEFLSQLEFKF